MKRYQEEVYLTIEEDEFKFLVNFVYAPGYPGVTGSLPENCYPPEPAEFEITGLQMVVGGEYHQVDDLIEPLEKMFFDKIEEFVLCT